MPRWARIVFLLLVVLGMVRVPGHVSASPEQAGATPPAPVSPSPAPDIALMLPTVQQVPPGLVITDDRERSLDEVTANFSDPASTRKQFIAWSWQSNRIRAFHAPAGATREPDMIDGIYISVHTFGSPDAAAAALDYSFDVQATEANLGEIPIDPLGDASRALYSHMSYGNEVTLYVQRDNLLIRLSASSPTGDPRAEAIELMKGMLAT